MTTSSELDLDATIAGDSSLPDDAPLPGLRETGSVIDRYVITGTVGTGSMGVVYSAFDPELDRKIALKLMRRGRSKSRSVLLRQEAQALAKVKSPHVVAVYDVGTVGDEIFIAMEFVDGVTLSAWRKQQDRDWRAVVRVFIDAGRGLAAAHAAGLVHGDFKPANVMVGDDGRAQVLDFGLAQRAALRSLSDNSQPPDASAQRRAQIAGTPAYMSPEQVCGEPLDAASDQFSFCVALWEALYGQRPFEGQRFYELAAALLEQDPRPPPNRRVAPKWLFRAVLRGLARDPAERWPSMDPLLQELSRDRARRRTVAVLGLLAAGTLAAWSGRPNSSEDHRCEREADGSLALWDPARQQAVHDAIVDSNEHYAADVSTMLTQRVDEYVASWRDTYLQTCRASRQTLPDALRSTAYRCLDRRRRSLDALLTALVHEDTQAALRGPEALESLPRLSACSDPGYLAVADQLPDDPDTAQAVAELRDRIEQARATSAVGRFEAARAAAQQIVDEAEQLGDLPLLASAYKELGTIQHQLGTVEPARESLRRGYHLAVSADRPRTAASAALVLAQLEGVMAGHPDQGREWAYHADAHLLRPESTPEMRARYHTVLGLIDSQDQRLDEAIAHFEQALTLHQRLSGPDSVGVAALEFNLAAQVRRRGDYERSRQLQEHGLATLRTLLGEHHPRLSTAYNNSATTLLSLGQTERAREYLERAQQIAAQTLPEQHPHLAFAFTNLTRAYLDEGDLERALDACDRALSLREASLPADHLHIAYTLGDRADVLRRMKRHDEATAAIERAITIVEGRGDPSHPGLAELLAVKGRLLVARGDGADAVVALRRALQLQDRPTDDYGDGKKALTQVTLAQALWLVGDDRPEALALAREGIAQMEKEPAAQRGVLAQDLAQMRRWIAKRERTVVEPSG